MFGQRPKLSKEKTWEKFDKRIGGGTIPKRKVVSFHLWQKGWFGKEEEMGYADWPNPKNWQVRSILSLFRKSHSGVESTFRQV